MKTRSDNKAEEHTHFQLPPTKKRLLELMIELELQRE
jgi:hypothetical protein